MRKFIATMTAGANEPRTAFQRNLLEEIGPRVAAMPGVRKLTVNLVQPAPDFLPVPPSSPDAPPACDAVMMVWAEEGVTPWREIVLPQGSAWYRVDEIVERDEIPIQQGRVTPGLRNVPLIVCQERHDEAARREKWRIHGALGLRIHTGMKRYVRNVVVESLTPGAPLVHGIGEVCFPTLDDLRYGLFPSPEDRTAFLDDVAGWVKASTTQYATEHVLKW